MDYKSTVESLMSDTDIEINGDKPCDIQVHNSKFYKDVFTRGELGLGESYMKGWWDCKALDKFFYQLFRGGIEDKIKQSKKMVLFYLMAKLFNFQTPGKSKKSIAHHYDKGNELYKKMLDPYMVYSCGFWKNTDSLTEAQEQKLKVICERLKLQPGQHVLDIGCGWGGFADYAATNYGVKVTGVTLSKEQKKLAEERCKDLDVEIRYQDYRELDEKFDKIVSIGMVEHVGHKNYEEYMEVINRNLKDDGLCFLSFIGGNKTEYNTGPWIHKYIFPNGLIPSLQQIGKAMEKKLVLEDFENIGFDYDRTLMAWQENFKHAWHELKQKYNEEFYRMWNFYLASSAASFRSRRLNLWQMVLVKPESRKEYEPVRL